MIKIGAATSFPTTIVFMDPEKTAAFIAVFYFFPKGLRLKCR